MKAIRAGGTRYTAVLGGQRIGILDGLKPRIADSRSGRMER